MPKSNNNARDDSIHNCCPYLCCIPDQDGLLITAHFLTIVGVILSSWSSFLGGTVVAIIGWIILLCSSCGHTSRFGIIASGVFLLLAAIASCIQGIAVIIGDHRQEDANDLKAPLQSRDNSDASSGRSTSENNNYDMVCHLLGGFTLAASGVLLAASVLIFILICSGRLESHRAVSSSQQDEQPTALGPIIIIELKPEDKNHVTGQQNVEQSEEEEVEIEDKKDTFVNGQQNVETSEKEEVEIEDEKNTFVTGQQNVETSEKEEEEIDITKDQEHFLEGVA